LLLLPWLIFHALDAIAQLPVFDEFDVNLPESTYERFAPLAEAGDPEVQHFLGYMYFYGEGVELDYDKAHYWFHEAAEDGELKSMRNLGLFHANGVHRVPVNYYDPREANLWFSLAAAGSGDSRVSSLAAAHYDNFLAPGVDELLEATPRNSVGETVYFAYCAGCHGFDGKSSYSRVPSFALGESLEKADSLLVTNITRALNPWPHPVADIPRDALLATLAFVRDQLGAQPPQARLSDELMMRGSSAPKVDRAKIRQGEKIYLQFCGGCHGFNGISAYVYSPSFALGERMHKSDEELAASIRNGRGEMPSWEFTLKPPQIEALVSFIRTFEQAYQRGIGNSLRSDPEQFFRFTPKSLLGPGQMHDLPSGKQVQ